MDRMFSLCKAAWREWGWILDPFMLMFAVLMLAGALLTSHGTLTFYGYLLPDPYPWAAVVVLTGGIMLFGIAGILDRKRRRIYLGSMALLLLVELLAQYLQGQATMMPRIREAFPVGADTGIDLVSLVTNPVGRVALPALYLAAFSLIVVGFELAFSSRVRALLSRRSRMNAIRIRSESRFNGQTALLASLQEELTKVYRLLDSKEEDVEQARRYAASQIESAHREEEELRRQLVSTQLMLNSAESEARRANDLLDQEHRRRAQERLSMSSETILQQLARWCREELDRGATPQDVARNFKVSATTMQSWIKATEMDHTAELVVGPTYSNGISH